MIDVHAPHEATHTWTDFFIHIGTIAVGLLIAIGLEQTVEALHHHHERDELIVAMRTEAQDNRAVFERTISSEIAHLAWDRSLVAALTQASPQNGMVDISLPHHQPIPTFSNPARATWTVAKTNRKASLLPDNLAETYNRLDFEADMSDQAGEALSAPDLTVTAITIRLGIDLNHASRLHLSVADRDALAQALAQRSAAWLSATTRMAIWQGANSAVADGIQSWNAMVPYVGQSVAAVHQAEAQTVPSSSTASDNPSTSHAAPEHAR